MEKTERQFGWLARALDLTIKVYMALLILVWITGGFDLDLGSIGFRAHKASSLFRVIIPTLLVRWLLTSRLSWEPFSIGERLRKIFSRALEIGILAHLILIPVVWHLGEFKSWFFRSPDLGHSFSVIFLMLLARFLLGRNRKAILALTSLVVTLLVCFLGLEIVLRKAESEILAPVKEEVQSTDLRNDKVNWTWGQRIDFNSFGYREKEFEVPKPEGLFRIMILGDSLTWGVGLAYDQRYSAILDSLLAETHPEWPVEVVNFGVSGGPTVLERDILVRLQDEVEPNLVVVGFCHNDPQPRGQNYSVERVRLHGFYNLVATLRHIGFKKTYKFIIERIDVVFARLDALPTWQEALDRTYQPESHEWQAFLKALEDIKSISDERQLPSPVFLQLTMNTASDNPSPPWETRWFAQAGLAAAERGFVVIDPATRFVEELTLADLPVNSQDTHPSAACNRIYGEELFRVVEPILSGIETR